MGLLHIFGWNGILINNLINLLIMIKINGKILSDNPFLNHEKIQDLVFYDAPLAVLYKYKNEYYVWWWLDMDGVCNRHGVFKTTIKKLESWREFDYSWDKLKDAIDSDLSYIINLDTSGDFVVGWEVTSDVILDYE
jgi:hypothetical protein